MREFKLDERLKACADMVEKGSRVVDVGTDHAYLPIWLVMHGVVESAIVSDVNDLPLYKAKNNIIKYKVYDKIQVVKSYGLNGIDYNDIDTIIVAGMGGELISQIISEALWIRKCRKKLILQPMSSEYDLRMFLLREKFVINKEKAVLSGRKVYSVISAVYTGIEEKQSCEYPYIGKMADNFDVATVKYIKRQIKDLRNRAKGAYAKNNLVMYNKNLYIIDRLNKIINFKE